VSRVERLYRWHAPVYDVTFHPQGQQLAAAGVHQAGEGKRMPGNFNFL